ncbi:MAG: nucleotidyltransferase family protein [Hyphomicrobiales bacterium]|nr:nucleotidyltransferase family protein [Hyphomicrobiales bacterium]MCP5001375.1 nucleotidyltransferase family protein [Hyphomicrobiales bacterium]
MPDTAMILAAGLGIRMRPITDTLPKSLVSVGGKPMVDYALDSLEREGIANVVVNVHHLAGQVIEHLENRPGCHARISDETEQLLDSGGGIVNALPLLGQNDLFILNADTFWLEPDLAPHTNLALLSAAWNPAEMDILLLTVSPDQAVGYDAAGDFLMDGNGRLTRYDRKSRHPVIYAGAAILSPWIFDAAPIGPFSLNRCFDEAIAAGRLFGAPMRGLWLTVGTPGAIDQAETAMRAFEGRKQSDMSP